MFLAQGGGLHFHRPNPHQWDRWHISCSVTAIFSSDSLSWQMSEDHQDRPRQCWPHSVGLNMELALSSIVQQLASSGDSCMIGESSVP